MRIALITPEYPGCGPSFGIGRYVRDLSEGLTDLGHAVMVVAATDTGCFRIKSGATPLVTGPAHPRLILRPLLAQRWLVNELSAFAPDIVELSNWGGLGSFLPTSWPTVVRLSTSAADPSFRTTDIFRPLRHFLERTTVQRATLLVADSRAMADAARVFFGRETDSVILHAYRGAIDPLSPRNDPAVLYVGRLERRKGIDVLLAAWPAVRRSLPESTLHIVGRDQNGFAQHIPAGLGITWHGEASNQQLHALRQTCRVQVVPSRFESFGLVVLEAWAGGLAVVASNVGGLPEVLGEVGLLVPGDDPAELAKGLIQALDTKQAERWAALGRQRLISHFMCSPWVEENLRLYGRAIGMR